MLLPSCSLSIGVVNNMRIMSKDAIRLCVKRQEFMDNPVLLQRLYLDNKGFALIQNLDDFKHLEVLHLEKNKIGEYACCCLQIFTLAYITNNTSSREDSELATFDKAKVSQLGTECNFQDRRARMYE